MTYDNFRTIITGKLKHPVGDFSHYAATHEYAEFGRNTCEAMANLEQRARVAGKVEV